MKFEVGDRVVYTHEGDHAFHGIEGEIWRVLQDSDYPYNVLWDDPTLRDSKRFGSWSARCLKRIETSPPICEDWS